MPALSCSAAGFASTDAAPTVGHRGPAEDYGLRVLGIERVVISSHNLMIWVTTRDAGRLMIKVYRPGKNTTG